MDRTLYERCKEYEKIFRYALKMDFLRISPEIFNALMLLYNEHTGKPLTKTQRQCNSCRLKAIKVLGRAYFEEGEKIEKEKEMEKEQDTVQEEQKPTKTVKRRGRPKKIDLDGVGTEQ